MIQQSAAFKILKTRLKAVPSYSFNNELFRRTAPGNPYRNLHHMSSESQISEDGDVPVDGGSSHNGINFVARLQQFEQMQHQHRMHAKAHLHSRNTSTSLKVADSLILLRVDAFSLCFNQFL